jgi:serine/threonine-protein kinase HipA
MTRSGTVLLNDLPVGTISEDENGYHFVYDEQYASRPGAPPISLTLPVRKEPYSGTTMIPFFDGLIPEGWLLEIAQKNWKLDPRDRMGLLLACCKDCIGAVSIIPAREAQIAHD